MKCCYRCTYKYVKVHKNGNQDEYCSKCLIILGGQQSWVNVKQYLLNKNYFSNLVLPQIKSYLFNKCYLKSH
mgnify:FL=1